MGWGAVSVGGGGPAHDREHGQHHDEPGQQERGPWYLLTVGEDGCLRVWDRQCKQPCVEVCVVGYMMVVVGTGLWWLHHHIYHHLHIPSHAHRITQAQQKHPIVACTMYMQHHQHPLDNTNSNSGNSNGGCSSSGGSGAVVATMTDRGTVTYFQLQIPGSRNNRSSRNKEYNSRNSRDASGSMMRSTSGSISTTTTTRTTTRAVTTPAEAAAQHAEQKHQHQQQTQQHHPHHHHCRVLLQAPSTPVVALAVHAVQGSNTSAANSTTTTMYHGGSTTLHNGGTTR